MRILFVHDHPFFKDRDNVYSGGGLPNSIWNNYLKYFSSVVVYGRLSKSDKDRKVISSGADGLTFVLTTNYQSIGGLIMNFGVLVNEIKNEVKESDIVLVRLPSVLGLIAAFTALNNNKKIIVEQVGNSREALVEHGSYVGKLVASLFHVLNKKVVKKAKYVSYVTVKKLQQEYPCNAVSVSLSNVLIDEIVDAAFIPSQKFQSEIFRIGLIGGFDVRYKGQDILLKAISVLPAVERKNVYIYFVGKGDFSWVIDIAKEYNLFDNIKFIGSIEAGKKIFDFLSSLSLYVQPSLTEGMPRALLEAMSVGCPGIGSDAGGIPDVISDEFIHKKGDYKALSLQIYKLITDREKLKRESERSISAVQPYLKARLDEKRDLFYYRIISDLKSC